ncbi:unnamed protein product [Rhizoctonia solani]|uniref:Laminin domain protein n=1 Tax=Rhizoctonia solani TaxID=456999 RepID=A0A8H3DD33_9AGAM|nr:unnamed protein product [Rhizoctonia solani]
MSNRPGGQIFSPPELPPYLKGVHDLKKIVGAPRDDEVIAIHAVIRMAQKAVDIPGTGDPALLARLSEHLFDVQVARYRDKYIGIVFPESAIYAPPTLPAHVSVKLEPVAGVPSVGDVLKVQGALRAYHQLANVPSLFDPYVDMELSQHLFDIQMARYTNRAREWHASSQSPQTLSPSYAGDVRQSVEGESGEHTNNVGTGANMAEPHESIRQTHDIGIQDALERSNRLAEQTNQLIERSNQIAEGANQLVEKSIHPTEPPNTLIERFNQLFERLNEHMNQSNCLAKESMQPMQRLGDILGNINKVLVRIQHAIVRNHKGNTLSALECLVNEKGETPAISRTTGHNQLADVSGTGPIFTVVIDGVPQKIRIPDGCLGEFARFYGIGDGLFDDATTARVKEGKMGAARVRLGEYLGSCLG